MQCFFLAFAPANDGELSLMTIWLRDGFRLVILIFPSLAYLAPDFFDGDMQKRSENPAESKVNQSNCK